MQFNITFKTIFEYIKKLVLCIQIRFVSTEKKYAHRLACILFGIIVDAINGNWVTGNPFS